MTNEELQRQFEKDGYVLVPNLLSAPEIAEFRAAMDRLEQQSRGISRSNELFDVESDHSPAAPRLRRVKAPHKAEPIFEDFLRHPRLLALLRVLLGPDIRHQYVKLNVKEPGGGSPLEWHQDWAFYPHTNDRVLAVGLMLDDVTSANGPTLVVPGSHRPQQVFNHRQDGVFAGAMDPSRNEVDYGAAVELTGAVGSVSIHDAFLVHGAARNNSSHVRRVCFYEFMAADAWPLHAIYPEDLMPSLGELAERIVCGSPTLQPRLQDVPVDLPLPRPDRPYGSIYEAQKKLSNRYFQ